MPTYYVEDFDNKKNADAVERQSFEPVSEDAEAPSVPQAKVVEAEKPKSGPARSSRAKTKG